mmetsp:Transcript_14897/g.25903  ORF Transcript_14897/g.25903 Transcript_14897/m.25903 type:complete len:130 (-) Transcript_14897:399-788(-)
MQLLNIAHVQMVLHRLHNDRLPHHPAGTSRVPRLLTGSIQLDTGSTQVPTGSSQVPSSSTQVPHRFSTACLYLLAPAHRQSPYLGPSLSCSTGAVARMGTSAGACVVEDPMDTSLGGGAEVGAAATVDR